MPGYAAPPFPRLEDSDVVQKTKLVPGDDEVILHISEYQTPAEAGTSIERSNQGDKIKMVPFKTTTSVNVKRSTVIQSPLLAKALVAPSGVHSSATCSMPGCDSFDFDFLNDDLSPDKCRDALQVSSSEVNVLEIDIQGKQQHFITAESVLQCLDTCAEGAVPFSAAGCAVGKLFSMFSCAEALELKELVMECRRGIVKEVNVSTVALALWIGQKLNDRELVKRCYWFLKDMICSGRVPPAWFDDSSGPVKLAKAHLEYRRSCRTPLRSLKPIVEEDFEQKRRRWMTATQGYTLCQLHRKRKDMGGYPHTYEVRTDHSNERVMTALKADEQSNSRIFVCEADENTSEFCEDFIGMVKPNFWGTNFTLFDCGHNLPKLRNAAPLLKDFPVRDRQALSSIGFETNLLGECPRKITLDFTRDGEKCHYENVAPRWDPKLNSYALPFFGRVKLASAKNFQLVANNDHNDIYLMFGKIQKDVFCLDFRHPITPLDAMAVAIAALAKKRAVS